MLTSDIDTVIDLIAKTYEQNEKKAKNDHIEKLYNILQTNENTLLQPVELLNSLESYLGDLDMVEVKNKINDVVGSINSLLTSLDSIDGINKQRFFELVNSSKLVDESIKNSWQQHISTKNKELANSLKLVEKLVEDKTKVLYLRHSIKHISQSWPIKKTDINQYDNAVNEIKDTIKKLDVNQDIQRFLLLAMNKEATLEDIDEGILEWLRKQKILSKMKITYSE